MWLLRHKNIHKKHLLWLKIVGLCLSFHGAVLLWVFCVYQENKFMYAFSVNKKMDYSVPILFKVLNTPVMEKTTITTQKTTAIKPSAPKKTVTKPITTKQKKTTTIATQSKIENKKIEEIPKIKEKSFDTPLRGTQDERKENKQKLTEQPKQIPVQKAESSLAEAEFTLCPVEGAVKQKKETAP